MIALASPGLLIIFIRPSAPAEQIFRGCARVAVMPSPQTLVTVTGECFDAIFEEARTALPSRDGTLHYFRLTDRVKNRGSRLVSLYFFNFDRLSIPQFDFRLENVRLNVLRRGLDSDALSFDSTFDPHVYREIPLTRADFEPHAELDDLRVRQFILHKAYWLSYKLGNYPVRFDDQIDLDYLGVAYSDVRRGIWYLKEEGLLENTKIEGYGRASIRLVKAYEATQSTNLPGESVFPRGTSYDAFRKITEILRSANSNIFIADNYLDETILDMLATLPSKPSIKLLTTKTSIDFKTALKQWRLQFGHHIEVRTQNGQVHDRAIVVDDKDFYALGASIKDAGLKLSLLSKLEDQSSINKLQSELWRIWTSATVVP
jgi:hypothetical protein